MSEATPITLPLSIAAAVHTGLTQSAKRLPPWLLYDRDGSQLFEEITQLPEYYPTARELSILRRHATQIISSSGTPTTVVELGAGSATKTKVLLAALLAQRGSATFIPIDVSARALELASLGVGLAFPQLKIEPYEGDYLEGLASVGDRDGRKLVLFIGSSIGNFEPSEALTFLRAIRARLKKGDALLLGTDLCQSQPALLAAYDDPGGVTARFNLNLLVRINRELGGHFDLRRFRHLALFDAQRSRVEMHLQSLVAQTVEIDALDIAVPFGLGERLHTENSYKFTVGSVQRLLTEAGFTNDRTWSDPDGWFAVHLAQVT
jgi:L-histidine N-alpha-methyltransferase